MTELSWDQVDVESLTAERDRWKRVIAEVREGNPEIDRLQGEAEDLRKKVTKLTESIGGQKKELDELQRIGNRSSTRWTVPSRRSTPPRRPAPR